MFSDLTCTVDRLTVSDSAVPCLQGRPTEATGELERPAYGAVSARDYIPGAEVLDPEKETEDDDGGGGWEDDVRTDSVGRRC